MHTQIITCDVRTFLMALATIHPGKVAEHVRPTLIAYQCEVADVIEAHFTGKGLQDPTRDPYTWDWDEVAALLAQRYGLDLDVNALLRALRDGGVLKKTNHPKKAYRGVVLVYRLGMERPSSCVAAAGSQDCRNPKNSRRHANPPAGTRANRPHGQHCRLTVF